MRLRPARAENEKRRTTRPALGPQRSRAPLTRALSLSEKRTRAPGRRQVREGRVHARDGTTRTPERRGAASGAGPVGGGAPPPGGGPPAPTLTVAFMPG